MSSWSFQVGWDMIVLAVLLLFGIGAVYWGLWGDRSKGRARCQRCWYDMRGCGEAGANQADPLICPECGHNARSQRRLHRHRRRWCAVIAGALAMSPSLYVAVITYGWWREQSLISDLTRTSSDSRSRASVRTGVIGPKWLIKRLSPQTASYFARVNHVSLAGAKANNANVQRLARFKHLKLLYLRETSALEPAAFESLGKLRELEDVNIEVARFSDNGQSLGHLQSVERLGLFDCGFSSANLGFVVNMPRLENFAWGANPPFSGEGFAHLAKAPKLRHIALLGDRSAVRDEHLAALRPLQQLETIYLEGAAITDEGIANLAGLGNLRELRLAKTGITDAGTVYLAGLVQLRHLTLSDTAIGDDGLRHLSELTNLKSLALTETRITDEGLRHLSGLRQLKRLYLDNTAVGDAGLMHLIDLQRLEHVGVGGTHRGTRVTDAGIARLQEVIPGVEVTR